LKMSVRFGWLMAMSGFDFRAQPQGSADSAAHPPPGPAGTSRHPAKREFAPDAAARRVPASRFSSLETSDLHSHLTQAIEGLREASGRWLTGAGLTCYCG
jgi:hypothetical protein